MQTRTRIFFSLPTEHLTRKIDAAALRVQRICKLAHAFFQRPKRRKMTNKSQNESHCEPRGRAERKRPSRISAPAFQRPIFDLGFSSARALYSSFYLHYNIKFRDCVARESIASGISTAFSASYNSTCAMHRSI